MEQLQSILTDLDNKVITKHQAYDLILVLFDVSGQSEQLKCPQCGSTDVRSHSEGRVCGDCNYVAWAF